MRKVCNYCKEEKELDEYHLDKTYKDGHKGVCKVCVKRYNQHPTNKARQRARLKLWRLDNPQRNLELARKHSKTYYQKKRRALEQELNRQTGCIR